MPCHWQGIRRARPLCQLATITTSTFFSLSLLLLVGRFFAPLSLNSQAEPSSMFFSLSLSRASYSRRFSMSRRRAKGWPRRRSKSIEQKLNDWERAPRGRLIVHSNNNRNCVRACSPARPERGKEVSGREDDWHGGGRMDGNRGRVESRLFVLTSSLGGCSSTSGLRHEHTRPLLYTPPLGATLTSY